MGAQGRHKAFPYDIACRGTPRGCPEVGSKRAAETETNFSVIGCGGQAAQEHVNSRGQHPWIGLSRTLVHISEAMSEASTDYRDSVGEPADYVIISTKGYYRIPVGFTTCHRVSKNRTLEFRRLSLKVISSR